MDDLATTTINGTGYKVPCDAWTSDTLDGPVFKLTPRGWRRVRSREALAKVHAHLRAGFRRHCAADRAFARRFL